MAIAFDRAQKPLRQLRKLLKTPSAPPLPEDVHRLRTRSRQIEAITAALPSSAEKLTRRLLKSVKPLRKAAGRVRDMDVLADRVRSIPPELHGESIARLLEYLESSRKKHAAELVEALDRHRKQAREHLKQYAAQLEKRGASAALVHEAEEQVRSAAARCIGELADWPALNARNLHAFRLKVKELRTVLMLLSDADQLFVDALRTVKDQIGEWHDWFQLGAVASQALDALQHRALLALIRQNAKQKLTEALAAANALRTRYFERPLRKPPVRERRAEQRSGRRSSRPAVTELPSRTA